MPDFIDGNREYRQFSDVLETGIRNGTKRLDDQVEEKPKFWIEVSYGGAGWYAVKVWDGMGFPEAWETGDGRYPNPDAAKAEARMWAAEEGLEFKG